MTITAKYPATCTVCRTPVRPGDKIEWSKGSPVRHANCGGATTTTAPARRPSRPGKWTGCACGSREDSHGDLIPSPRNCASCEHDA
jgi:hypothetical protein